MDENGANPGMFPDQLVSMLMISKLSTGHSALDMALVALVPWLLRQLLPHLLLAMQQLWDMIFKPVVSETMHERVITFTQKQSDRYYWSSNTDIDKEPPNHLLQAALLLHLNRTVDIASKTSSAQVQLRRVRKQPAAGTVACDASKEEDEAAASVSSGSSSSCCSWNSWSRPSGDELLLHLGVALVPPQDTWVELGDGLMLKRSEEATSDNGGANASTSVVTTTVVLLGATAAQVDGFIARAWDAFREERRKKEKDESRYLYMPVLGRGGPDGDNAGSSRWTYKRYQLSDDKSFASLFHPDKAALLELLDAFAHGRGKFAIPGYPQKLGFLLHGPPGTGKTSLIKALAAHMGRSIVSVPLSRVRTNQELMDMMFDQAVAVEGRDMPVALPFSSVIYIFEDVDACGDIVQRRDRKTPPAAAAAAAAAAEAKRAAAARRRKGGWVGGHCSGADLVIDITAGSCSEEEDAGAGAQDQGASAGQASGGGAASPLHSPGAGARKPGAAAVARLGAGAGWPAGFGGDDALDLAGLLNVLDGVVDTPGRIVVLTSNHPEKLDPALIRPGRVNKKIYMGLIAAREARQMVAHWFGRDALGGAAEAARFGAAFADGALSPAALEAMCAEHEEVGGLLAALEAHPSLAAARAARKADAAAV